MRLMLPRPGRLPHGVVHEPHGFLQLGGQYARPPAIPADRSRVLPLPRRRVPAPHALPASEEPRDEPQGEHDRQGPHQHPANDTHTT